MKKSKKKAKVPESQLVGFLSKNRKLTKSGGMLSVAATIGAVALAAWATDNTLILKGCAFGFAVFLINITMDSMSGRGK